jgi:plasmid stabilization system protein ParE
MSPLTIIFAPRVDTALVEIIDHADVDSIPTVLNFLERIQTRLVETLSTFPEAGAVFQGDVRMFPVDGYVFLYEHHAEAQEVHILDLIAPGRNWR